MAQFYTLDEAAQRLQMPADEFKKRLKTEWTSIRPFRDGPTLRFRVADIDELARSLGGASDPGLQMGPVGSAPADSSGDFVFTATPAATTKPTPNKHDDEPLHVAADDDIFSSPSTQKNKPKSGSDSDVRLDTSLARPGSGSDNTNPTEEISIDFSGPSSAIIKPSTGSGKLTAPKSGTKLAGPESGKIPGPSSASAPPTSDDSSSEFELSLDPDNDSFEFQLTSDSSEEVDLGGLNFQADNKGGHSGINLAKPSDSGPSLEKRQGPKTGPLPKKGKAKDSDSDIDFELSLDGPSKPISSVPLGAVGRVTGPDSDSEFELTLDDNSGVTDALAASYEADDEDAKSDIFETDFELPAMDDESASEVVTVDSETDLENADFESLDDDSASQVVLVDDDFEAVLDDDAMSGIDLEDGASASQALRGARRGLAGDYDTMPSQMVVATPATWGALPAVVLFMTLPLMFIGTLMSYEVVRGMWGYHQPTRPGNLLVRSLAETIAPVTD